MLLSRRVCGLSQIGVASIALAVQRAGGSQRHPAEELNDTLETMAAGIEGGALPEALVLGSTATMPACAITISHDSP